ncbi:cytochrome P450 [Streptomyces sp. RY43-2]|uniref:Cytochrome P450 n=1 Tax=Streptomyces macrolidinus TaxID=2952607 RepID=A0ABT0ZN65_9ACTN|nr:cytochrome P450 [Streptomyces macrolidinus]MCN9244952.1 cytochrome P450 [Streptomyces macrolidinus]
MLRILMMSGDPVAQLIARHPDKDPYSVYESIREKGVLVRGNIGAFATCDHELASAILRDSSRFGSFAIAKAKPIDTTVYDDNGERLIVPMDDSFLSMDPPDHTRLRRMVAPWFSPRAIRERTATIETMLEELLDDLAAQGEWDAVNDLAVRVPIRVISAFFGIGEEDFELFRRWGGIIGTSVDGIRTMGDLKTFRQMLIEMQEFFGDLIELRKREPGNDLVTFMVQAEPEGEPLSWHDMVATCGVLLGAGFETTVNLIGNCILTVLSDPDLRQQLIDSPELIPNAVEEVLRWDAPVQYLLRVTTEPVTIAGVDIPADSPVFVVVGGANRDPKVFGDNAQEFDLHRKNSREHLTFGDGIHLCVGAGLARIEAAATLRVLLRKFPDLHLADGAERRPTRVVRGMTSLPVRPGAGAVRA